MFRIPISQIEEKAYQIRRRLIELIYKARSGHLDTSLSLVEVWLGLVYSDFFRFDPKRGDWDGRDRIFLSEGHACPLQYVVNADLGYYPYEDVITGNRKPHSPFQGHSIRSLRHGLENANGSLGVGLWHAYGCALETGSRVFCIAGDGEFEEPASFALLAAPFRVKPAGNFTLIINNNKLAQDAAVELGPVDKVAELFGWHTLRVNGHDLRALGEAYQAATGENSRPSLLICDTVKGKGGDPAKAGKLGNHGKPPQNEAEYTAYLEGLEASRGK